MLNCNGCDHKSNAVSNGYCSEFHLQPEVDKCMMHTQIAKAPNHAKPITEDRPGYIWLNQSRERQAPVK